MNINRRESLRAAVAALTAAAATPLWAGTENATVSRIRRIELFPVRYPMTGYFKFFTGPHGSSGRAAILVKLTADDGVVGWGQSIPIAKWSDETLETAYIALRSYFGPAIIGQDPHDLESCHAALDRAIAPGYSTGMPIARAGIDLALHDLVGIARQIPVPQMWQRSATQPLELSWTVNVRQLDEVDALVEQGRQRGYRHFNIKVAPDVDFDVQLARSVRALAPDGFLWADANGGYDPETALDAAPQLADAGVDVLEAPLRPNRISGYQALRRQAALPILMDEGVLSPVDLAEFHQLGMLDGVAMKPARCGGLLSCRRQIEYCEQHGLLWLASGLTDPDVSLAASLLLYSAYACQKPAALNGPQFLTSSMLQTPLRIADGRAHPPTGFGLGIQIDEAGVRELADRCGLLTRLGGVK